MENNPEKIVKNPHQKVAYILALMRFMAFTSSLCAVLITVTNKEAVNLYGFQFVAKYKYSHTLRFFVAANSIVCGYSLFSLPVAFTLRFECLKNRQNFSLFLLDMVMMVLTISAASAATAEAYLGVHGNKRAGWLSICDNFSKFCFRNGISLALSFIAFLFYFSLVIFPVNKMRSTIIK